MLYRDLVQFEPIETVIQLRTADEKDKARGLVKTYVISKRMADQLVNIVIPQLQFLSPEDNKGVLIVGNYGTGKSHLMALVSAVAEHADLVADVDNANVRKAAADIAGRFKVARVEIGAVTGSLRDILLDELEVALAAWGTPFSFPAADAPKVSNNKDLIIKAVAAFQRRYPDKGILLVVDELLDYLRGRKDRELILDLGFLRELGEVCAVTAFRFLGGLQETLFDSPRFAFVAQQLRRVRDRFEQVRIAREDVAYVVSHRLLVKTDEQLARITEHLRQFTPLYHHMAERLGEFAQLFPVHPAYIETFERVYVAEKREVLKTLSGAMRSIFDQEVPADRPGLISYDQYWGVLCDNPSMRSLSDVAEVIDKSNVLEGRVRNAYTRPHLRPMAIRIIHALSVQRLTTDDIHVPLGVTPEELRDGLCLHISLPERTAEFLLDQVQVALREIERTVNGQFISRNETNGQYYLDVKKFIDYDAQVEKRGDGLDDDELNRYFYDALRQAFNLSDTTYVTGHRIWFYELPWQEHKVTRPGYLFFGAPNDRSTAQPPRDFYVYILPPFPTREWHDEQRSDEVFFELTGLDQTFKEIVQRYAGARAMFEVASGPEDRNAYAEKADVQLRDRLLPWLRQSLPRHLQVTYQGVSVPIGEVLSRTQSTASRTVEELLQVVASHLLAPEFEERYPDYPTFSRLSQPATEAARPVNASEAIGVLAGRRSTALATAVLEGLELLDDQGNLRPYGSRYALHYLDCLRNKEGGQVVNRGELIEVVSPGIEPIEKDLAFSLEPEWVAVALLALVYNGDIELSLDGGQTLNASNITRAANLPIAGLAGFRFYRRPRELPIGIWVKVLEGLELSAGLVRDPNARAQGVRELQRVVGSELERAATLEAGLQQRPRLWNAPVFTDDFTIQVQAGVLVGTSLPDVTLSSVDLLPHVREYKQFLDRLSSFNTVGKLRNLRMTMQDVEKALAARKVASRAERLLDLVSELQPLTTYLVGARANLSDGHPWAQRADETRKGTLDDVRRLGKGQETRAPQDMRRSMETLKVDYVAAYSGLHRRLVLGPQADDRRTRLYRDPRLAALNALSAIDLLNRQELQAWKNAIKDLPTCRTFHEGVITDQPTCPYCHLRPS